MDKFWVVAKREYLERVRSRWFVIMTLFIPALISGVFLVPLWVASRGSASASVRNIIILDATGDSLGRRVAENLMADSSLAPPPARRGAPVPTVIQPQVREITSAGLADAEKQATQEVMKPKSVTGYLVLDDSVLAGTRVRYAGRNASSLTEVDRIRQAVRQAVTVDRLQREGVKPATIAQINNMRLRAQAQRIDERGRGASGQAGFFLGIGIGILLLMSISFHGQAVLRSVLEEKTTRVAEVVISSVKPETLLAGKVAGAGAVGLTQQVLWIAISAYLINMVAPLVTRGSSLGGAPAGAGQAGDLGLAFGGLSISLFVVVVLYFLFGFVFYASLLAAAGAMVNSEQDAQQAAMPVLFLLMGTWIFVNSVLVSPNGSIAVVLSWLPFSSPIVMPMRMGLASIPWTSVAGSLAVCALGCAAAVWIAARIYRVGMLMYGKKPAMGEVIRWIRAT